MPYQMQNGQWRAAKMIAGQRKTKVFATKTEAKKWEAGQKESDWQRQEQEIRTISLHDVASAYLDYSKHRFSYKTYKEKQLAFKQLFAKVSPIISAVEIKQSECLSVFLNVSKDVSNAAANKMRKNLGVFWAWGTQYYGFPKENPFIALKKLPEAPQNHYVPPADDFWKAYECAEKQDKTFLLFLLHTGARKSEATSLLWEDVDLKSRRIMLETRKTKDGSTKQDWLTMTNRLHSELTFHKARSKNTSGHVFVSESGAPHGERKGYMQRLCKLAKVKHFGFHGIRGLTATILASEHVPLPEIQKILRHSNPNTTARYIRSLGITSDVLSSVFDRQEKTPEAATSGVAI